MANVASSVSSSFAHRLECVRGRKKIVLFYPPRRQTRGLSEQRVPLELLAVARLPLQEGFEVVVVDGTVEDDFMLRVVEEARDALCVGLSCIIGWQTYGASRMATALREHSPETPLVWGGWFSSVQPDPILREGLADCVVRGQGEVTFLELVEAFRDGGDLAPINGLSWVASDGIRRNEEREITPLNTLPPMPYELIDFEPYFEDDSYNRARSLLRRRFGDAVDDMELRALWYFSSFGCPEPCSFCCSPAVTGCRWTALEPTAILDQWEELRAENRFNLLHFYDANFTVNPKRLRRFCEEILKRGDPIPWAATAELMHIDAWPDDLAQLVSESGCYALYVGVESASTSTLQQMRKVIDPTAAPRVVRRMRDLQVTVIASYVVGVPGEPTAEVMKSVDQACLLRTIDPGCESVLHLFLPLPGTEMYDRAAAEGLVQPQDVAGWQNSSTGTLASPVAEEETVRLVRRVVGHYFTWGYYLPFNRLPMTWADRLLSRISRWRVSNRRFGFPIEFWLYRKARRALGMIGRIFGAARAPDGSVMDEGGFDRLEQNLREACLGSRGQIE